ncbi:hypothetical protein JSY14_09530 [Brachybacterium sp. EF45031]|uniref:hypothetical protein n=1 Tax=Brachybacterium sillae TaxID=2810536 RepID=UPI00217DDFF0|nr:hypothetical protein [Brachybacterium sillae]MCS6712245.1 hypothetical protein [Brachybacterium sillae]
MDRAHYTDVDGDALTVTHDDNRVVVGVESTTGENVAVSMDSMALAAMLKTVAPEEFDAVADQDQPAEIRDLFSGEEYEVEGERRRDAV